MATEPTPAHFAYPELSAELARIDRPWRRLWLTCGLLGAVAVAAGAVGLYEAATSASKQVLDWLGAALLLACLVPSVLVWRALRDHPLPPTDVWISDLEVRFVRSGGPPESFRWSEVHRTLVIGDLRATRTTWRQDGSRRSVEFILFRTARTSRTPLPPEALAALLRTARSHGFTVRDLGERVGPQGIVRLTGIDPAP